LVGLFLLGFVLTAALMIGTNRRELGELPGRRMAVLACSFVFYTACIDFAGPTVVKLFVSKAWCCISDVYDLRYSYQ